MLQELYQNSRWKTFNKFYPIAAEKGFSKQEVRNFLNKEVVHDKLKIDSSKYFLPIYSKTPDSYQFDTLIQSKGTAPPAFLIFININSRKGYAYPLRNKNTDSVMNALNEFVKTVHPKTLTSDQDSAYLAKSVTEFFNENNITHYTTEKHNHNILGIINRLIRTLRDLNRDRDFTIYSMNKFMKTYNDTIHSSTGKPPNKFTSADEQKYIQKMNDKTDDIMSDKEFKLNPGDKVRVVIESDPLKKKRSKLSQNYYIVDSEQGNGFLIKAADESIAYYPRHKLIRSNKGKYADSIDNNSFGIIDKIIDYDVKTDKYKVVYEGGVKDKIPSRNLRGNKPTHLGIMEVKFWKNKTLPERLKKFKI